MRALLPYALLALASAAACAAPNLEEPDYLVEDAPASSRESKKPGSTTPAPAPSGSGSGSTSSSPYDAGSSPFDASHDASPFDAGPQSRRWKGSLATTFPASFGGGEHCTYRVTLKQVAVDVTAAANGDVVAATVTAQAVEDVLSASCPNTAIPAHKHTYVLIAASPLPNGSSRLELAGISTNHPAASLVVEGDFRTTNPELSLAWHRIDYGPPLDWRINAKVTCVQQ